MCLEGEHGLFQSVLLKEVVIEPNVKLECVPFCYLGSTLGAGGGVEEAARARVRCAWVKFKELSPILTAWSASYCIKGKMYKACVQSALTYGTETWGMKKANLHSLERTEWMMARWMCRMSLKDRKCSVDLYSLLSVQSVTEVVRRGRLRWFGHVERKSGDDWVLACRNVVVAGVLTLIIIALNVCIIYIMYIVIRTFLVTPSFCILPPALPSYYFIH